MSTHRLPTRMERAVIAVRGYFRPARHHRRWWTNRRNMAMDVIERIRAASLDLMHAGATEDWADTLTRIERMKVAA